MSSHSNRPRILIIDDEPIVVEVIRAALEADAIEIQSAETLADAMRLLAEEPSLAIIDKNLPDGSGLEIVAELRRRWPYTEAIIFTGYPSFDSAVDAMRLGVYDYVAKPPRDVDELRHKIMRALERRTFLIERERMLVELREAQRVQAMAAHSEMMAQLGRMLAGIVHEIRSPLGFVGGNIQHVLAYLQGEGRAEAEYIEALEDAMVGVNRIASIVGDIRRVSAVSAYAPDKRERVALREVVDLAVALTRSELSGRAAVHVEHDGEPCTTGSNVRLTQVLVNLLVNAGQAVDPPSGKIVVRTRTSGARVSVSVNDNGRGIPPELIDSIFEPFFTTKDADQGTGLGLSLAREIAREHGGTLQVSSTIGSGSCFKLDLPAA